MWAALLIGCGIGRMLPGPPALSIAARAAFDAPLAAEATYTGPPRVAAPVLPLQVWGLQYALDVVLVSDHPDWSMHEYARIDLPSGPIWLAKDADADGNQGIVADLPDIATWVPEVPAPRVSGPLRVTDLSTTDQADLRFEYTNPHGDPVVVTYRGAMPTKPSNPRNGNTMGHSTAAVGALLDLHLFQPGGDATVRIGGEDWRIRKLLGMYPLKFLLAQTQGGYAATDFRVAPAPPHAPGSAPGDFLLTRPDADAGWPTASTETWVVEAGTVRHVGPITTTTYTYRDRELGAATVHQAGLDVPVTAFSFRPALPDLSRPFLGTVESAFAVDIAGQRGHGTGRIRCVWTDADTVSVAITPLAPAWFADRPMVTTLRYTADGGYRVRTARVDASPL